jgi:glycosyltransferase involved in cell wall biosynthesis
MLGQNFTGIGRYVTELVNRFIALNQALKTPHDFVLFLNKPQFAEFALTDPHVKKVLVSAPHYSFSEQFSFFWKLHKERLDIVHFPHFNVPVLYRRPFVVTVHDLTLSFFPGKKMTKWYHRLGYEFIIKHAILKAKKIIAVSENTKKDILKNFDVPDHKIKVIYNGISENFHMLKNPSVCDATLYKYEIKKQFLLYTGVWRDHKNLPNLLRAFSILRNEKNLDFQLVIPGKPDPVYDEVIKIVKELNLQDDVVFTGMVPEIELNHLYNAAFIYVFPSLYEGFGLPPLESMKCGTPVAASNLASIPEVCGDENAMYFDPCDPKDMAEKIELLASDTILQADLIEKGMQHTTKFSWEKSAKTTFEILKNA